MSSFLDEVQNFKLVQNSQTPQDKLLTYFKLLKWTGQPEWEREMFLFFLPTKI